MHTSNRHHRSVMQVLVALFAVLSGCGPQPRAFSPAPATRQSTTAGAGASVSATDTEMLLATANDAAWQDKASDPFDALVIKTGMDKLIAATVTQRKSAWVNQSAHADMLWQMEAPAQRSGDATATATLMLKNATRVKICYLYISPVSEDNWGDDWLGDDETIAPGATRRLTLKPGVYDLRAKDCDQRVLDERRAVNLRGHVEWAVGNNATGERPQPTPTPAVRVALSQFLCCGHTAGGTRIWGISYPRSWRVDLIPNDPDGFLAAMFSSPRGDMKILIAPSAWTPIGTVMDTGDVDQYLNGLAATRRQQHAGFTEFLRQPVPGFPTSRVWSGNWPEDHRRMWESYLAMVTPMPHVEGMPRGTLTLMGLYAESSQWATARAIYERMLGTLQVQVISTGAAYVPPKPGPSNDPEERSVGESGSSATHFWELVFCPKACEWQYIDVANQPAGGVWTCTDGCVGQLSEVACTPDRCY